MVMIILIKPISLKYNSLYYEEYYIPTFHLVKKFFLFTKSERITTLITLLHFCKGKFFGMKSWYIVVI